MKNKIKEIIYLYRTELEETEESIRKDIKKTIIYCIFVGIMLLVLGIANINTSKLMMVSSFVAAIVCFIAVGFSITLKVRKIPSICITVCLAVLFSICIFMGGNEGFVIIWIAVLPPVAMFAHGLRHGTIFSLYFQIYLIAIFYTPLRGYMLYQYPDIFAKRFPIVYTVSFVSTLFGLLLMRKTSLENEAQRKELDELRIKAEAANKAKSEFLSKISHEIRTPINAVLGLDEMICRESSEEHIRDYAYDLKSSGKTLLSLINDLLDQSRLEAGKIEIRPVEYSTIDMINDLSNMISLRAVEKGLAFTLDIDEELPRRLIGDEVRIKQIITNILTNAVKYTPEGEVNFKVSFSKKDENNINLFVAVKDTGIGMKPENIDSLFKPFERIEEKRNMKIEGTGLGMSITQNLLNLMGTELKVDSVYGEGSTFYFSVKQGVADFTAIGNLNEAAQNEKREVKKYKVSFTAPDAKILVVDDNHINLKVFAGLLKQTKINIMTADSGKKALEILENDSFDMIFLDHMMPEMDGIETLCEIKKKKILGAVIALTANASSKSRIEYISCGFDDYLAKPIDMILLERVLKEYIEKSKIIDN